MYTSINLGKLFHVMFLEFCEFNPLPPIRVFAIIFALTFEP